MKGFKMIVALAVLVGLAALVALGVMALWNGFVPEICGFSTITYWQAVGLLALGQLLSGGIIMVLFVFFGSLHALVHPHKDWRNHWHNMSEEERQEFINRRRELWGFHREAKE
ncbi:MAG: hypothetical protein HDS65_10590 [Bacteroidales bacterium]|nr:hypothetical protein [Bacteroidales bacterium]